MLEAKFGDDPLRYSPNISVSVKKKNYKHIILKSSLSLSNKKNLGFTQLTKKKI